MASVRELQPGGELAGYRIDAVERREQGVAVLLAHELEHDRAVVLHVAAYPPGELATTRFVERARRLSAIEHPHLLAIDGVRTIDGRCVAVAQAPPGRRLDALSPSRAVAVSTICQVAGAIDALEDHGLDPPPLGRDRIWVGPDAQLDGLHAPDGMPLRTASAAAELASLLETLTGRLPESVMSRAREGAYLSAGQFAAELRAAEAELARRRRSGWIAAAVSLIAVIAVVLAIIL